MRRLFLLWLFALPGPAAAFSALSHQAVIDSCWERSLVPALNRRYPDATPAQLRAARSYAYGGALIHDMGYFPGNGPLFTDLAHYVRTGDFVRALLDEARDRNEYAFALGALAHYVTDASGHPAGTNQVMDVVFPELHRRLGSPITYAQAPQQHSQVEYAFDVAQVRAGRFRSEAFHAAIGLRVSQPVLERAFRRTYGLALRQVLPNVRVGLAAFRFVASELLPAAVRASQHVPGRELSRLSGSEQQYYYEHLNSGRFRRRGRRPDHLSGGMRLLVIVAPTLSRLGVVKLLAFRPLPPAAEATMRASFAAAIASYETALAHPDAPLANLNLDTGRPTQPGEYALADRTYGRWLTELAHPEFAALPPALRREVLAFSEALLRNAAGETRCRDEAVSPERLHDALFQLPAGALCDSGRPTPARFAALHPEVYRQVASKAYQQAHHSPLYDLFQYVEPYATVPRHEVELGYQVGFNSHEAAGSGPAPANAWGQRARAEVGLTNRLMLEGQGFWQEPDGEHRHEQTRLTNLNLAVRYRLAESGRYWVDPAVAVEYRQGLAGRGAGVEARLILSRDFHRFTAVTNFGYRRGGLPPTRARTSAGALLFNAAAAYQFTPWLAGGVEYEQDFLGPTLGILLRQTRLTLSGGNTLGQGSGDLPPFRVGVTHRF